MEIQKEQLVENASIDDEIIKAERSEGYLIMITRLNDKKLTHTWFTQKFSREDIPLSIAYYNQSLKKEMLSSTADEPIIEEVEKTLPPEYRK